VGAHFGGGGGGGRGDGVRVWGAIQRSAFSNAKRVVVS